MDKLAKSVIFRQPERLYDGYVQKLDRLTTQLMNTMQTQFNQASQRQQLLNQRLLAVDLGSNIRRYQERFRSFSTPFNI